MTGEQEATRARTEALCGRQNELGGGVFHPSVCPWCFGCPIATIVVGVAGGHQMAARAIPVEHLAEVNAWLDKVEVGLA